MVLQTIKGITMKILKWIVRTVFEIPTWIAIGAVGLFIMVYATFCKISEWSRS